MSGSRPVVHNSRWTDYLFATFDALELEDFAESEWCDLGGELYDGVLYAEEPDNQAQAVGGRS